MAAKSKAQTTARAKTSGHAVKKPVSRASAKPVKSAAKAKPQAVKTVKAKAPVAKIKVVEKAKVAAPVKKPVVAPVKAAPQAAAPKVDPKAVASFKAAVAAARAVSVPAPSARAVPAAHGKSNATRITEPVAPVTPKSVAEKAAAQLMAAQKKPVNQRHGFKTNEFIVYPAHGVGRIVGIEEQEIAGMSLELFVINFDKEKLTLRVPTGKLESVGMRKLAEDGLVKKAMETLKGRARVKRTMWSRRAQEYVAKINSGDLISIAEVVRDLYRSDAQPEQSYSERQLYEDALDRMAREIAAVEKLDERGAVQRITEVLSKSAKGRRAAEAESEAAAAAAEAA
jgi:CarD family transcriptional regulator